MNPQTGRRSRPILRKAPQTDFYRRLVHRCVEECRAHYSGRLISMYVYGSVHRGEAVSPISDLDMTVFIADGFSAQDAEWRRLVNSRLAEDFPAPASEWMPRAISVSALGPNDAASEDDEARIREALRGILNGVQPGSESSLPLRRRGGAYLLRYDSTLVWGRDLIDGIALPIPDALWAQVAFQCPWDVVRHAAGLEVSRQTAFTVENVTEWPLPEDDRLRLRKLARLGVLGGAYALMISGGFRSYKMLDVLPQFGVLHPEWSTFLDRTASLSVRPNAAEATNMDDYLPDIVKWMDWLGDLFPKSED